jgi:hypothetical protein
MKTVLLLLVVCTPIFTQTQDSLRAKYGAPISETFIVRPGISVTATFSPTGGVREMIVSPERPSSLIKSTTAEIEHQLLKEIIDELAPRKERGEYKIGSILNLTCLPKNDCAGSSEDYEKLVIYYNAGRNGANYAVIQWKNAFVGAKPQPDNGVKRTRN